MTIESPRSRREAKTLTAMVEIYCHGQRAAQKHLAAQKQHDASGEHLCFECQNLLDFALIRLSQCPFGAAKPTCANCPIHCYRPAQRAQIKAVMRYAGPRMLLHHPMLTLRHLLDGLRKPTET